VTDIDKNIKVLIVDDSKSMRNILKKLLAQGGMTNVIEADSGTSALLAIKNETPDVALLDWILPDIDGIKVLRKIRENPASKNLPVIMLTSKTNSENIQSAKDAGVNDYLIKPATKDAILKAVGNVLKN